MTNLTETPEWLALSAHFSAIKNEHMREWFQQNPERFSEFSLKFNGLLFDYSRNRITSHTKNLLINLANAAHLSEKISAFFNGDKVNFTENRPALHTALRDKNHIVSDNYEHEIGENITKTLQMMRDLTEQIHQGKWLGATKKPIKHIVNIGIGGSFTGPKLGIEALSDRNISALTFHSISTVDHEPLAKMLAQIDPETTLFIISSKSFTTLETLTNAKTIIEWMDQQLGQSSLKNHFIAVTAEPEKAAKFGMLPANIFPMWDWIGGRYSVWSAIGLPIMLMIGYEQFIEFLAGAAAMDKHFQQADFAENIPVLLALLDIWYINFFNTSAHAIIPYAYRLRDLIAYLQQLEMESNGKKADVQGTAISHATSPVIFGAEGCIGQHAYHQLLHQGHALIPADFILVAKSTHSSHHQDALMASGLSQIEALLRGKTFLEAHTELLAKNIPEPRATMLAHHQVIPGNKPSTILFFDELTPFHLGMLLALYEHKVFVQGVLWGINSFDQFGVELGKQLLPAILAQIHDTESSQENSVTKGLIDHYKNAKGHS